ncbi:hypothetical protein BFJ69_g17890 [Fusarium oxysporum]|uniref:Uncharacterized protein n=1 Tax=Fusarium oxysporum TaxID=5507 RepID=A0A420M6Y1_FUSOX|nr:hypothetical protein BFJ69_g17890 [Fusarium oxysporum]
MCSFAIFLQSLDSLSGASFSTSSHKNGGLHNNSGTIGMALSFATSSPLGRRGCQLPKGARCSAWLSAALKLTSETALNHHKRTPGYAEHSGVACCPIEAASTTADPAR